MPCSAAKASAPPPTIITCPERSITVRASRIGLRIVRTPATAPALLFVAILMLRSLTFIDWDDSTESAPAIACVVTMAYTFSISDGIAFGVISYVLVKVLSGQWRQVSLPIAVVAALFVLRFAVG